MATINPTELQVLKSIAKAADMYGCNSCYSEDVIVDGLSVNQIKGYLSQLMQKGLIDAEDSEVCMLDAGWDIVE